MKTIITAALLVCLGVATWGGIENHQSRQAAKAIAALRIQIEQSKLDSQSKDATISDLQAKMEQIVNVLTNSTAKLAQANGDAADLKRQVEDLKLSQSQRDEQAKMMAQVPANEVWSKTGKVLLVDAQFVQVDGRRVIFKHGAGMFDSYDVDDLHPAVLARLHINPDQAKQRQITLNEKEAAFAANRQREIQEMIVRQAQEKAEQDRIAAEQAKQDAINARQAWEDGLRATQANNDTMRARAAVESANAAMYQALNPASSTVIQQSQQQQNFYRVGY
jgi:hypothetical protein